jgi:hypothetical protein
MTTATTVAELSDLMRSIVLRAVQTYRDDETLVLFWFLPGAATNASLVPSRTRKSESVRSILTKELLDWLSFIS